MNDETTIAQPHKISRRWIVLFVLFLALSVTGIAVAIRQRTFGNRIDREIETLLATARTPSTRIVRESDLHVLPAPVQRWLRTSGVVGTAIPTTVRLSQEGEFRLGANKPWMPFHATQHYTTNPPGYLWQVSMRMFPLIDVAGRDRYFEGTGEIEMRLASIIPVARASGGNLDRASLLRYLNEMMWFPAAAILPNISWEAIDDTHARATLTDADRSVSAIFVFDDQDRLIDMTAERWNDSEQTERPWSTPLSAWGEFEDIVVPIAGIGRWGAGEDIYDYIRLRITDLTYTTAEHFTGFRYSDLVDTAYR